MRQPSPSRRTPSSGQGVPTLVALAALALAAAPIAARHLGEPDLASVATSGVTVSLSASFCNGDGDCDPEENFGSCPADCDPAPEPDPEPAPEEERERHSASGRRSALLFPKATTTEADPDEPVIVAPEAGEVQPGTGPGPISSAPTPPVSARAERTGPEEASVSWSGAGGAFVRVLRGDDAFPTSPDEGGVVVYEGRGSGFVDGSAGRGLYSIFVRQPDGSYAPAVHAEAPAWVSGDPHGLSPDYVFETWWPLIPVFLILALLLWVFLRGKRRNS